MLGSKLPDPRQIVRAYLVSVGVWCALSLLTGWSYYNFYEPNLHASFRDMLLLAGSRGLAYALLTPPIFYLVHRYADSASRAWYPFAYALGLCPFMLLYACIRWVVLPPWDSSRQQYVSRLGHGPLELIYGGFADQITIYIAIVVAAHAFEYFQRVRKQELERYEYQQALAACELQALKMQLHPHFLFNTLHGISTLIDSDGASAKAMIVKLSSLLRTALQHSGSDLVPLQGELKFVREYLELEEIRFGKRLRIVWSIAPDTHQVLVPQLILQPVVENAIRHGIAGSRDKGFVEISAERSEEVLELRVRNSVAITRATGNGVGLRNTAARLRHLYSDEATFSFTVAEDHAATTILRFPALSSYAPLVPPAAESRYQEQVNSG
jgi:two-component system LytT family sensor kinase